MQTRTERDSMGDMQVPADALYGASTARAVENFPIARRPLPPAVIHAYGHLKAACAQANRDLGLLDPQRADAIIAAADEVAAGQHDAHFPVDVYQTGSGTSTNMNVNEVIATLANRALAGVPASAGTHVHPNDHVNLGQSSNDTFPTAMLIAGEMQRPPLQAALQKLAEALASHAASLDAYVKIGRTHGMDATPIRVGQVFQGFAEAANACEGAARVPLAVALREGLPVGGTAVGTGINTDPEFAARVVEALRERTHHDFRRTRTPIASHTTRLDFVTAHQRLKTVAVTLSKIANDLRLLASGPRAGLGELILPAVQPGSSIMPGKVNPVICESVIQVCCRVIGNDATITTAALGGVGSTFELNTCMPLIIDTFLESTTLLTNVTNVFVDKCVAGITVNEARCKELLDRSLMTVTALAPRLGYDTCAAIAKQAHAEDKTIREVVRERGLLTDAELDTLLDYDAMTRPAERPSL